MFVAAPHTVHDVLRRHSAVAGRLGRGVAVVAEVFTPARAQCRTELGRVAVGGPAALLALIRLLLELRVVGGARGGLHDALRPLRLAPSGLGVALLVPLSLAHHSQLEQDQNENEK